MDNDLLAFPQEIKDSENNSKDSFLPGFPKDESGEQLNPEELIIVRRMISEYKAKNADKTADVETKKPVKINSSLFTEEPAPVSNLFCDEPQTIMPPASTPFIPTECATDAKNNIAIQLLEKQQLGDSLEADALKKMIEYTKSADDTSAEFIAVSILGLIPCKKFIRHGTPEQKLFVLKSLGDRFLDGIAGIKWNDRRKLIKVVANYLSSLSENYNFIPMEGEGFNPTLHERVLGASSGNIIKEMRGFLVVAKGTNRVTYAGVVLT